MRKIMGGLFCCCLIVLVVVAQANAQERIEKRNSKQVNVETLPDGVQTEAGSAYYPSSKKGSGDSSCNDKGDTWILTIKDDKKSTVSKVESNQLVRDHERFSKHFAGTGGKESILPHQDSMTDSFVDFMPRTQPMTHTRTYSKTGRWWRCGFNSSVLYPEDGVVDINALVLQAIDEAKPGSPVFNISPNKDMILVQTVHMHGIDATYWKPYSATASAGTVSVTATMTPIQSRWDSGEPNKGPVICNGPGKLYSKGVEATKANYPCSTFYNWATTDGDPYTLTTTVVFDVTATSSLGPLGPFPPIAISTTDEVYVKELQAVVVANE